MEAGGGCGYRREMTSYLYGRPPAVFDPPGDAVQTAPTIPGSTPLEDVEGGAAETITIYAPPGVLERRYTLALGLRALATGGRLDVMAPKDKGGSRLRKELEAFGLEVAETAKAHHRRCIVVKPAKVEFLDNAIEQGAPRVVADIKAWSQPGIFAWNRHDQGSSLLWEQLMFQGADLPIRGAGVDLGCGNGALDRALLADWPRIQSLRLVDIDRRAIEMARRNVTDHRASFEWADARTLAETGDVDFVISNPPFHDGGAEDRRLGQAFIRKAAGLLKKGGVLWLVANRHLPYEAELDAAFRRVRMIADAGGYKVFEAVR